MVFLHTCVLHQLGQKDLSLIPYWWRHDFSQGIGHDHCLWIVGFCLLLCVVPNPSYMRRKAEECLFNDRFLWAFPRRAPCQWCCVTDLIIWPCPLSTFPKLPHIFYFTRLQGVFCLFSSIDFTGELLLFADSLVVFSVTFRRTLDM